MYKLKFTRINTQGIFPRVLSVDSVLKYVRRSRQCVVYVQYVRTCKYTG